MKILCVFGEHHYGDPSRGQGYEYSNFLPALRRLGEVVHFESFSRAPYKDFAALNRALVNTVLHENPDVVFFVLMGYEVWTETLAALREHTRAALLHWGTDDSWKYRQFSRHIARYFDVYATTSDAAFAVSRRDGLENFVLTQWAASADRLREPLPAAECHHAVSFVGSAYGNRPAWIRRLADAGIIVECFGHGWPRGSVTNEEVSEIMRRSRICLNFGDSGLVWDGLRPGRNRQIKARIFEVPGAGGLLLSESAPGLDRYYRIGEEVRVFDNGADLVRQIRELLGNPPLRDRIATAGHTRTRVAHTYDIRLGPLVEEAVARRARRGGHAGVPNRAALDAALAQPAMRYRAGPGLRGLRALLIGTARLLFGNRRGPRAARRFLFELSWRIAGARTYSAAGWPGRIFYRES